jgi:hypothetical protein
MIKGYKASYNQSCLGHYYGVGQKYEMKGPIKLCLRGFHFCENVDEVLHYYDIENKEFILFEINAIGDVESENDKSCTNKIEIVRIIPKSEYNNIFTNCKIDDNGNVIYKRYPYECRECFFDEKQRCIKQIYHGNRTYEYKYHENEFLPFWRKDPDGTEYEFKNNKWCKIEKE